MDYYKILNVSKDASKKEIETSYKDLTTFYNPETNSSKLAYRKYKEINYAYKMVMALKEREEFNIYLKSNDDKEEVIREKISIKDFNIEPSKDINEYKDELIKVNYIKEINIDIDYLYYILNSKFTYIYDSYEANYVNSVCSSCLGVGKVKRDDLVSLCPSCLGKGKKADISLNKKEFSFYVNESEFIYDNIKFNLNYVNKDRIRIKNNKIEYDYLVSEYEYYNGVKFKLFNDNEEYIVNSKDFNKLSFKFNGYDINITFILDKYKGNDLVGYIICDKECVYLDFNDYSYTYVSDDRHTYKVINGDSVLIKNKGDKGYNDSNGDLIIKFINLSNNNYHHLIFNKTIKRIAKNNFRFKNINKYEYKGNDFYLDDKYIYLPSSVKKEKNKNYLYFKILYLVLFILVPFILFLVFGVSKVFFIASIIYLVIYFIVSNILMEVKL